jgi:hypothetical protein
MNDNDAISDGGLCDGEDSRAAVQAQFGLESGVGTATRGGPGRKWINGSGFLFRVWRVGADLLRLASPSQGETAISAQRGRGVSAASPAAVCGGTCVFSGSRVLGVRVPGASVFGFGDRGGVTRGRRLEVGADFDEEELRRLVALLESLPC